MSHKFSSGFVALVGRPNAGKSSFLNACLQKHVASVSPVSQTTRTNLRAILNLDSAQIVFIDTPGVHKPKDELGKELNKASFSGAKDADIVLFFLDATAPFGKGDAYLLSKLTQVSLVITKADLAKPSQIYEQIDAASKAFHYDDVYVTSAKTHAGIEELVLSLQERLPEGPRWFENQLVDIAEEKFVANIVEEQIMLRLADELPHACACLVEEMHRNSRGVYIIRAILLVEKESQQAIVVGKGGSMIKKIGMAARTLLEDYLGSQVYLDLRVKVRPKWRKDCNVLRELGF